MLAYLAFTEHCILGAASGGGGDGDGADTDAICITFKEIYMFCPLQPPTQCLFSYDFLLQFLFQRA